MTLNDLLIDCCTRLNYPPDLTLVDAKVQARLKAFINQTQLEILGQPTYIRLLRVTAQLQTKAGQAAYGLPELMERVTAIVDVPRRYRLGMMSLDAYRRYSPDPTTNQGTPTTYAFNGWGAAQLQPSLGANIYAFATQVDQGTRVTIKYATLINTDLGNQAAGNLIFTASVVLTYPESQNTGNLLVSAPPQGGFAYFTDIYLDKPAVSHVDIGTYVPPMPPPPIPHIARIPAGDYRSRYAQIHLFPTPSGSFLYTVYGEHAVRPLVNPSDESVIPPRFHYILAAGARMKEYELRGDTARYTVAKREYDIALGFLNSWVSDQPDAGDQMHPDDYRVSGPSVLGPWFPASGYRGY